MKKLLLLTLLSPTMVWQAMAQKVNAKKGSELIFKIGAGKVTGGFIKPMQFQRLTSTNVLLGTGTIAAPTTKIGINGGIDYNYYFGKYIGASATADVFSNAYNLIQVSVPPFIASQLKIVSQQNQSNIFVGAGPIGRLPIGNKFSFTVAAYAGYLMHKKNKYQVDYIPRLPAPTTTVMKFNDTKGVMAFAVKGSARVVYNYNTKLSASLGVTYIVPNFSRAQNDVSLFNAASSGYGVNIPNPYHAGSAQNIFDNLYNTSALIPISYAWDVTVPLKIGAINVGIHYSFAQNNTPKTTKQNNNCKNVLVVVKDDCSGVLLQNVNVMLKKEGAKMQEGYTNQNGEMVFNCVTPKLLEVTGIKSEVATNTENLTKKSFNAASPITVILKHNDPRFTMVGSAVNLANNAPIENVTAVITNLTNNTNRTAISNANGQFFEQLEQNCDFKIVGQAKGKFSAVKEVSTKNLERCKDLYVRIEMPMDALAVGKKFILNNIYYDLDKDNIRQDAAKELDILVDVLKLNPTVKIELGSHTDSRQTDAYNLDLSTRRAKSAVAYIVSKGIDARRLEAKGYGETQLVNGCADGVACTEEQHQANRRTEVKIMAY